MSIFYFNLKNLLLIFFYYIQKITPEKSTPKKRTSLPHVSLTPRREPLLDKVVVKGLDNSSSLLYQALMSQSANTSGLDMDMSEDIFWVKNKIKVIVSNIIDLFMDGWLNISILQIACMQEISN
jgi:hypothetical protein